MPVETFLEALIGLAVLCGRDHRRPPVAYSGELVGDHEGSARQRAM